MPKVRQSEAFLNVDTSALAAGDICSATNAQLTKVTAKPGVFTNLVGVTIYEPADQTAGTYDIIVLKSDVSLGTVNGAPSISDQNVLDNLVHTIEIPTSKWKDIGGIKVASLSASDPCLSKIVKLLTGTTSLWFNLVSVNATPTFTAQLKFVFDFQDMD